MCFQDDTCPLARELDMLRPFESIKKLRRRGEWQCTHCNKIFRGEDFLDKHHSRKHIDLLNHSASTCLEDYCDILECDHDRIGKGPPANCNVAAMKLLQHKCEALMRKCVPIEKGTPVAKLSSIVTRKLCGRLTCEELDGRAGRPSTDTSLGIAAWFKSTQWFWGALVILFLIGWFA